jgi:predicted RNA-binding protein YlxR (DUF448 family)
MPDGASDQEADRGPRTGAATRLCIATRAVRPADEMIRFVVAPDNSVVPDLKQNLPGRGVWVSASRQALADALRKKAFARGFKAEIRVSDDLADLTERLLEKAARDALSIAGKAGAVISGFAKVEAALAGDGVAALLHGREASADGIRKLAAVLHRRAEGAPAIAMVDEFTTDELDLALGRSNVVHAALLVGPTSRTFLTRLQRLRRFRTGEIPASGSDQDTRDETRPLQGQRLDGE